mmetsp:Transcript_17789/g.26647  ORF Transcript_17789/g.26647 Transcript_17789/m.26647 type:complete len:149 (+) Transcript_17789:22-468(+)
MAPAPVVALLLAISCSAVKLTKENFQETVIESEDSWLVEFYSEMCGACGEFAPMWSKITKSNAAASLRTAKVNIDEEGGIDLAMSLQVLEGGLPAIRLYTSEYDVNIEDPILEGNNETPDYATILSRIQKVTETLEKGEDGFYKKKGF